jgi:hypothetical protein
VAIASPHARLGHRKTLFLGTEPTDGYPKGTTVGGLIVHEDDGSMWKLLLGPIKQACWTGK